jgi:hypothetical protein
VLRINSACARIKETQEYADAISLVDLVARSPNRLRNELRAAAEYSDAMVAMIREAQESALADTEPPAGSTL